MLKPYSDFFPFAKPEKEQAESCISVGARGAPGEEKGPVVTVGWRERKQETLFSPIGNRLYTVPFGSVPFGSVQVNLLLLLLLKINIY